MIAQQAQGRFYRDHGIWSDPGPHALLLDVVPSDIRAVAKAVQGVLIHDWSAGELYSDPPPGHSKASRATLPVADRLGMIEGVGDVPLNTARPTSARVVGTCRDFALLACSILRHQGFAARVRCSFARYFKGPGYADHWICEYREHDSTDWSRLDAQLDAAHLAFLSIGFDPVNLPRDVFLFPWQVREQTGGDPGQLEDFGHGDAAGFWFVRVNLARDLLALGKREVSAWDTWRDQ